MKMSFSSLFLNRGLALFFINMIFLTDHEGSWKQDSANDDDNTIKGSVKQI